MNFTTYDIATLLVDSASGLNLVLGSNLHLSKMPDSPVYCVTLYDSGGLDREILTGATEGSTDVSLEKPFFQIRMRDTGYEGVMTKASEIASYLHGLGGVEVNSTLYMAIIMQGDILFLEYDENKRPLVAMNFRVLRRPV